MLRAICIALVGRRRWVHTVTFWTELYHANLPTRTRGLAHILRHFVQPGDFVVDVGANIGRISHALARAVGPAGRVLALEPTPMARRVLEALVRMRGLRQVTVLPAAAGDADGELVLLVPFKDDWKPLHQITHVAGTSEARGERLTAPCHRLDTLWRQAGEPDVRFIKCDTEGHELCVLAGAEDLLARCRPTVFCEVEDPYLARQGHTPAMVFARFHGLGYWAFQATGPRELTPVDGYRGRSSYLFVHPCRWPAGLACRAARATMAGLSAMG